jgi:hypothetical protein
MAMQLGANIESRHIDSLRYLRHALPTILQQLQLLTALDEYKNDGTSWIMESKGLVETASTQGNKTEYDNGDEFWFSGLGHVVFSCLLT